VSGHEPKRRALSRRELLQGGAVLPLDSDPVPARFGYEIEPPLPPWERGQR